MAAITPVPRYQQGADLKQFLDQLCNAIDLGFSSLGTPVSGPYAVSNLTPTRTINAGTATTAQTAEVLGTLIQDLRTTGRLL